MSQSRLLPLVGCICKGMKAEELRISVNDLPRAVGPQPAGTTIGQRIDQGHGSAAKSFIRMASRPLGGIAPAVIDTTLVSSMLPLRNRGEASGRLSPLDAARGALGPRT